MYRLRYIESLLSGGWKTPIKTELRKNIDIFDYKKIAKPLSYYPYVEHKENNLYGNGSVIKKSIENIDVRKSIIEHGLHLGDIVPERYLEKTYDNIITFSEYRKNFIEKKTDKKIITIGPYIKYAKTIFRIEEVFKIKSSFGKILLVFPSHSIDSIYASYNINNFIEYIKKVAKEFNFKKILVCLYWKDIELGFDREYCEAGFSIVTAGHIYDNYFLDRLKTLILISDNIITNNVGTHIGYSVALDKPIHIWNKEKVEYKSLAKKEYEATIELNSISSRGFYEDAVIEISNNFNVFEFAPTNNQKLCIEYYWGL